VLATTLLQKTVITDNAAAVAPVALATLQKNAVKFATCSCMNAIVQHATTTSAGTEFPTIPSTVVHFADPCVKAALATPTFVGPETHTARFVVMAWQSVAMTIHPMSGD
jgi:hypothetical protein